MKETKKVEKSQKKYNARMSERRNKVNTAGRKHKEYITKPQARNLSIPSVQRVSEPFEKSSNLDRMVAKRLKRNSRRHHITDPMMNPKLHMSKKARRRLNKELRNEK